MTPREEVDSQDAGVVRSEEQLHVGTMLQDKGRVFLRKLVGERHDVEDVEREVEQVEMETAPAEPGDDGQVITLPDGSLSVPVFEERIFVEKRMVVRERVVLRKHSVTHREQVHADVRVEHVEVVAEASVRDRIDAEPDAQELVRHDAPLAVPTEERSAPVDAEADVAPVAGAGPAAEPTPPAPTPKPRARRTR